MKKLLVAASFCAVMVSSSLVTPALAGIPMPIEVVCPLDGQKFTHISTGSYSTWGMYMDGMPVGSWQFPMPVPQCPTTRLPVMKDEYSDVEKAALNALVVTPEYKAVQNEASYYLMDFVMAKTGEQTPESHIWMLLQATWQVREDVPTYNRYTAELVAAIDGGSDAVKVEDPENWLFYQLSVANVQRQSGDFEGAASRLALVEATPSENSTVKAWSALSRTMIAARDNSTKEIPKEN